MVSEAQARNFQPPMSAEDLEKDRAILTRSPLSRKQLNYFRDLLLRRRAELIGDVTAMESEALMSNSSGDLSHMPLHMADAGSDTFEQEFMLRLAATERELLTEINEALRRIASGAFGICEETGRPIGEARLEAKPWARLCIEAARQRDRRSFPWQQAPPT